MNKEFSKKFFLVLTGSLLLYGCGGTKNSNDFDISGLKIPVKKTLPQKSNLSDEDTPDQTEVKNNLIPLEKREEIISSVKFGKNNPFSSLEQETNLTLNNIKVTGFLLVNEIKYALVNYIDKSGSITSDSIGGINTDLLPEGAQVKEINLKKQVLVIVMDDQSYEILLE